MLELLLVLMTPVAPPVHTEPGPAAVEFHQALHTGDLTRAYGLLSADDQTVLKAPGDLQGLFSTPNTHQLMELGAVREHTVGAHVHVRMVEPRLSAVLDEARAEGARDLSTLQDTSSRLARTADAPKRVHIAHYDLLQESGRWVVRWNARERVAHSQLRDELMSALSGGALVKAGALYGRLVRQTMWWGDTVAPLPFTIQELRGQIRLRALAEQYQVTFVEATATRGPDGIRGVIRNTGRAPLARAQLALSCQGEGGQVTYRATKTVVQTRSVPDEIRAAPAGTAARATHETGPRGLYQHIAPLEAGGIREFHVPLDDPSLCPDKVSARTTEVELLR
jgi:hypothetical protein